MFNPNCRDLFLNLPAAGLKITYINKRIFIYWLDLQWLCNLMGGPDSELYRDPPGQLVWK